MKFITIKRMLCLGILTLVLVSPFADAMRPIQKTIVLSNANIAVNEKTVVEEPKNEVEESTEKTGVTLIGQASYYSDSFDGKKTANGEIFRQNKLTAACNSLPLNTWIEITNLKNGKKVIVKTNDRMHPRMKRVVDLSRSAAQQLGFIDAGLARVKVAVLKKGKTSKEKA